MDASREIHGLGGIDAPVSMVTDTVFTAASSRLRRSFFERLAEIRLHVRRERAQDVRGRRRNENDVAFGGSHFRPRCRASKEGQARAKRSVAINNFVLGLDSCS